MADPTLESLFQINKDGIRNKLCLEREMVEKLSRKHSNDLLGPNTFELGILNLEPGIGVKIVQFSQLEYKPSLPELGSAQSLIVQKFYCNF